MIAGAWLLFLGTFVAGHLRTRRQPKAEPEVRVRRDRTSDAGMALQFLAAGLALSWGPASRPGLIPAAVALAAGAITFNLWALFTLGRQWRVQAVIARDHQLVTTGPYRIVRHPIYLAFLLMVAATLAPRADAASALVCLTIFLAGTGIRIRAEERLLVQAFGPGFDRWRNTVPALLPGF